ncbi:uncharacterized protein GGS25DRAFT_498886 [Hypoxylon fragiforme]|uniref:uncharacterized protein n=1 Tax=Hypoxylon fragiforme TaxID=63214 RepID=UPI0020C62F95|nr:uncharacterized protein GGS25DRAFT_498886 [Hypoxylon fragiforme]KAI2605966.1 hypothetical protein GGS25DRAFT_498886 [Hypoxylon fragiforme]
MFFSPTAECTYMLFHTSHAFVLYCYTLLSIYELRLTETVYLGILTTSRAGYLGIYFLFFFFLKLFTWPTLNTYLPPSLPIYPRKVIFTRTSFFFPLLPFPNACTQTHMQKKVSQSISG